MKACTYELPHELPNDLRFKILGNEEISGNSQNFTECQNENFAKTSKKLLILGNEEISGNSQNFTECQNENFAKTSKKLLKNRN